MNRLPALGADGRARSIAVVALLAVGQAAAAGIAAFATRDVFAALGEAAAVPPTTALLLLAASGLGLAALRIAERVRAERLGQDYAATLRLALFRHVARLPASEVARRRAGALALRFVGDLQAVRGWISSGVARLISSAIVLPATVLVLFALNPVLAAAAAGPLLLGLLAMAVAGPALGPAHHRLRERRARLAADMSERLPHGPELRLLGRVKRETRRLERRTAGLVDAAVARALRLAALQAIPDVVSATSAAALLFAAWSAGAAPAEAAGALAALGLATHPLRALAGVWDRRRAWVVARDKCEEVLAVRPVARKPDTDADGAAKGPALAFAAVRMRRDAPPLTIVAGDGEKVAVVGPNGAGKSTLLALAAGLEGPAAGRVSLAGRDVRGLGAQERARRIAFAGPRSPILKGTLRRALAMGCDPQPGDDAIEAMAERAGLGSVLARLGGLDGTVREGGRNLSAGEARRILLVRALLGEGELLLLDEPDDALDPAGNALWVELVRAHPATTIVVTHDLGFARRMDRLWYVADHGVVESGAPEELLAGDGPTARFFRPRPAA